MFLSVDQGDHLTDSEDKGDWAEWRILDVVCNELEDFREQVWDSIKETYRYLDHTTKTKYIEVKNWADETYSREAADLLDQLSTYKSTAGENGKTVMLVFYRKLSDANLNDLMMRLKEKFGDFSSWLQVCESYEDFIVKYKP